MFNEDRIKEFKAKRIVIQVPPDDELAKLSRALLDENGNEWGNPLPDVIPTEERPQLSLQQQILKIMNHHLIKRSMTVQGFETEEEANDFDVGEEEPDESIFQNMTEEEPAIIDNNPDVVPDAVPEGEPATPENPPETAETDPAE